MQGRRQWQGHQQHGNGNGYGHCRNEGNPGHGGTPPGQGADNRGKGRSGFTADPVAPCSTVIVAGGGWQPGAPVQLSGGFDGTGCNTQTQAAGQPISGTAVVDDVGNVYAEVMVPADVVAGEERALVIEGTAVTGEPRSDSYFYEMVPALLTTTTQTGPVPANATGAMAALGLAVLVLSLSGRRHLGLALCGRGGVLVPLLLAERGRQRDGMVPGDPSCPQVSRRARQVIQVRSQPART